MTRGTRGEKALPTQKISINGGRGAVNRSWGMVVGASETALFAQSTISGCFEFRPFKVLELDFSGYPTNQEFG